MHSKIAERSHRTPTTQKESIMCNPTIAKGGANSSKVASAKGPLGEWQPTYDLAYSIMMNTVNMPHLALLTAIAIVTFWLRGDLKITPAMPLVAMFVMVRVPFIGFGMSMCLHRYFAHGAFKTSRFFQFVLGMLGSLANQGGILWWAGKHRRHHKHCDQPQDPHSATQTSFAYAWLWWLYHETHHDWAFIPQHLQTPELLFLNLFFAFPNALLTLSLVPLIGKEWALFLCWVPGCLGCIATLHFNVEYHPAPAKPAKLGECLSIDKKDGDDGVGPLRLTWLKKNARFLFEPLLGETYHDDHHDFPRRAHRPGLDAPYYLIIRQLAYVGIIWDLQQPLDVNPVKS
jgi:stearoyl-CoA desaturase (Delta-9 desaturase)